MMRRVAWVVEFRCSDGSWMTSSVAFRWFDTRLEARCWLAEFKKTRLPCIALRYRITGYYPKGVK